MWKKQERKKHVYTKNKIRKHSLLILASLDVNALCRTPFHFLLCLLCTGLLLGTGATAATAQSRPGLSEEAALHGAFLRIDSLRMDGEFQAALTRLSILSQQHPESVAVLWRYALVWSDYGEAADDEDLALTSYRHALTMANRALSADSSSAWAHLAKAAAAGRAAPLVGSNKEGVKLSRATKRHADRTLELDATITSAYYIRGVWHREVADLGFFKRIGVKAYGGLPDASLEQSVADLKQAIEMRTRTHHHLELGRTYMAMGKTEAAREQFQRTLDVLPASPFALQDKLKARTLLDDLE